jgi:hypothetical protein
VVVALGIVVAVAVAGGGSSGGGRDFDPRSTGSAGTKALVDTLRALDVVVTVDARPPAPGTGAVLLFVDALSPSTRGALSAWVDAGGTLVLADDRSDLNPFRPERPTLLGLVDRDLPRRCNLPALRAANHVHVPSAVLLRPRPPAVGCFSTGAGSWLMTQPQGRGDLVVLGGGAPFTNGSLGDADNGLLAVTLLAPTPGTRVQVFPLPAPGGGRRTLVDLVSTHVKLALVQLLIAFVVFALWRARRLGRPVIERQPVQIPGSELVAAVGRLFQRGKARERAAALVREDARRTIGQRLGLGPDASIDAVADAVAARGVRPVDEVRTALDGPPPSDERQLVAVAQDAESLTREVTSGG